MQWWRIATKRGGREGRRTSFVWAREEKVKNEEKISRKGTGATSGKKKKKKRRRSTYLDYHATSQKKKNLDSVSLSPDKKGRKEKGTGTVGFYPTFLLRRRKKKGQANSE